MSGAWLVLGIVAVFAAAMALHCRRQAKGRRRYSLGELLDLDRSDVDPGWDERAHFDRIRDFLSPDAGDLADRVPRDLSGIYDGWYPDDESSS